MNEFNLSQTLGSGKHMADRELVNRPPVYPLNCPAASAPEFKSVFAGFCWFVRSPFKVQFALDRLRLSRPACWRSLGR